MPTWRSHWSLLIALLAAAVPVAFGGIRAVTTGIDFRYLWMAAAAILGSMASVPGWRSGARSATVPLGRAFSAVALGSVCAAAMGVLQGARSVPSVALVAVSFGLCTGTSAVFVMFAREAQHRERRFTGNGQ